ncbi:hypothetical protein GGS23DRAFT_611022 [Durotheca rogersii]|uniref:uncharacterized protein n=1 Tax=Durotheca rogersii TaxID=419775 RepID=UPI00221E82F3|nr:uncharacterized protein GGS23DRAFT_611022 [Durotheca rogersii]KAI5861900.1 hypothetical protein GGS23DRAFT_611022 [Durotheca rogersii]
MVAAEVINNVIAQGYRLATHSWEYGAFAEALLEWYDPGASVFGGNSAFPGGGVPVLRVSSTEALTYTRPLIWTNGTTLIDADGSAGDAAALGVPAILIGQTEPAYLAAAGRQVRHLLDAVPRWPNGAISHRETVAELWADFVYMAPPTLAYWAVQTRDPDLLAAAVEQCLLYGDVLGVGRSTAAGEGRDAAGGNATDGLWRHIVGPQSEDLGLWSTGNAWAAAGMSRVLATAAGSGLGLGGGAAAADDLLLRRLRDSIRGILDAAMRLDAAEPGEPLLRNYLDDATWFGELAGTTLLAATAYRMARLAPAEFGARYVRWADAKRRAAEARVDARGLLAPVVNPLDWRDRTPRSESPEAQSFAVLMFAAHRDYLAATATGADGDVSD